MKTMSKSGFISILGRPNVGKSTLLNRIINQKVAIVTNKPQTTRNRITAIKTLKDVQMVFMDTPGIYEGRLELTRYMRKQAFNALKGADLIIFMTDRHGSICADDEYILSRIKPHNLPVFFVLNKVDQIKKNSILSTIDIFQREFSFKEFFPISALEDNSTEDLEQKIISTLPDGPFYFPEDITTDQSEKFLISEFIREKIFQLMKQEVPYSTAVTVEKIEERKTGILVVYGAINVEKDSQRGILIGKNGGMLKKIGTRARKELEERLGAKIYLDLRVKVKKDWSRSIRSLKEMGYE